MGRDKMPTEGTTASHWIFCLYLLDGVFFEFLAYYLLFSCMRDTPVCCLMVKRQAQSRQAQRGPRQDHFLFSAPNLKMLRPPTLFYLLLPTPANTAPLRATLRTPRGLRWAWRLNRHRR